MPNHTPSDPWPIDRTHVAPSVAPPGFVSSVMTDSQAQQAWWSSMTPEQREDYEDAIARRKAERWAATRESVAQGLRATSVVPDPSMRDLEGGEWS